MPKLSKLVRKAVIPTAAALCLACGGFRRPMSNRPEFPGMPPMPEMPNIEEEFARIDREEKAANKDFTHEVTQHGDSLIVIGCNHPNYIDSPFASSATRALAEKALGVRGKSNVRVQMNDFNDGGDTTTNAIAQVDDEVRQVYFRGKMQGRPTFKNGKVCVTFEVDAKQFHPDSLKRIRESHE